MGVVACIRSPKNLEETFFCSSAKIHLQQKQLLNILQNMQSHNCSAQLTNTYFDFISHLFNSLYPSLVWIGKQVIVQKIYKIWKYLLYEMGSISCLKRTYIENQFFFDYQNCYIPTIKIFKFRILSCNLYLPREHHMSFVRLHVNFSKIVFKWGKLLVPFITASKLPQGQVPKTFQGNWHCCKIFPKRCTKFVIQLRNKRWSWRQTSPNGCGTNCFCVEVL